MRVPYSPEFGQKFSRLLKENGLIGEDKPIAYLDGVISRSTLRNWRKGNPAPNPDDEKLRSVVEKLNGDVEELVAAILQHAA